MKSQWTVHPLISLARRIGVRRSLVSATPRNALALWKPLISVIPESTKTTMSLDIQIAQNAGVTTVKLTGSLDTATAPELERRLVPALAICGKDMAFDLDGLKFISSAGLRVFSIVRKQLKERGGQASFINLQPQIKEVFEIIQALPGVGLFANEAEFDAYLAARQKIVEEGL